MTEELSDDESREVGRKARAAVLAALSELGGEARRQPLLETALANGGFTARELAAPAPAVASHRYPSAVERHLSWALTNLRRNGLIENPSFGVWKFSGATAADRPENAVPEPIEASRLAELQTMPYRLYLRTPEWQRTRGAALARADHCCALDRAHTDNLEVHHNTYERLGEELTTDLVVLCHACHWTHHQATGRPRRAKPNGRSLQSTQNSPLAPRESAMPLRRQPADHKSLLRRLFGAG